MKCMAVTLLTGLAMSAQAEQMRISVRLYNYTALPEHTLMAAERKVADTFGAAGIFVFWSSCPVSEEYADKYTCTQVKDPLEVFLKILPDRMVPRAQRQSRELGAAARPDDAYIFFDRLERFCYGHRAATSIVLSEVMVHELGHLLLEPNAHSSTGIMRSVLNPDDLAGNKRAFFTREQAEQMRLHIKERTRSSR